MKTLHNHIDKLKPGDALYRVSPRYGMLYMARVVHVERNQWGDLNAATISKIVKDKIVLRRTRSTLVDNYQLARNHVPH